MMNVFVTLILPIFAYSVLKTNSALDTSKSRSFPVITRLSHKLLGHILKSVAVPSQIYCAHVCMSYSSCVSTNYGLSSGPCELNDHGVGETGIQEGLLEYHTEFVYNEYGREDCQLRGCRNGGTCVFSQESKIIHCVCTLWWIGDLCDVKKDLVFNFTTLSSKGRKGPTSGADYKGSSLEAVQIKDGLQKWIVPITGRYQFEACGASGGEGNPGNFGGKGAKISGEIHLLKGTVLTILVGQQGQSLEASCAGSGGGGTFIVYTNATPVAIVGGGGGGYTESGDPGQEGRNGSVHGGSNGSGGIVCQDNVRSPDGGSGGGLKEDGCCLNTAPCICVFYDKAGIAFANGGGGGNNMNYPSCDGGFGGGGAYQSTPGGGGGFSGGGATDKKGGGGGSFKLNETWIIMEGVCGGHGYVLFRYSNA